MSATITAVLFFLMLTTAPAETLDFNVDHALVKTVINSPNSSIGSFTVTNSNKQAREFVLSTSSSKLQLSDMQFVLQPSQSKTIPASIRNADRINTFEIYIDSGKSKAALPVIVEYEDKDFIYNALVKINQSTKRVKAGDDIIFAVDIFDLEDVGTQKVNVEYDIFDQKNEVVLSETDDVLVSNRYIEEKSFTLPSYLDEGNYVLAATLTFNSKISTATDTFIVEDGGPSILSITSKALIVLIILVIILLYLMLHTHFHIREVLNTHKERIFRFKQRHLHAKRESLLRKLKALDEAYKHNLLSKERHREAKRHFKQKIKDIEWFIEKD